MFKRSSTLAMVMTVAAFTPSVWSDVPAATNAAAVQVPQAGVTQANGMVSLDFQDADIRNVLKVLAFKSGVNIVAAPDVTGVINIELKDVPWQKALEVILSTYGYGYDRKGNIITVMTVENLKKYREDSVALENQEPLVSKAYALNFAKAADAMKIVEKLISKRGFVNFDERTNSVIVWDLQSNQDSIATVVKSIDTVTPQVMIETKVIETDLNNSDNIGVDWVLQATVSGAARPTIFPFVQAKPGRNGQLGSTTFYQTTDSTLSSSTQPTLGTATTSGFTYGTIDARQLSATLSLLSSRTTTKILSAPRIVTLDNLKAKINVGITYPVPNYTFNASTGQEQVTGYTPLPIGVNFEVTPHVNNAGFVTLDLHPQISAFLGTITVQNNPFPETSNQEAETNVMVEDGRTLVIGGLITDQKNVTSSKVPFLGDIPWLGNVFKSSSTTVTRKELIIFMTPHIITAGKPSATTAAVQ